MNTSIINQYSNTYSDCSTIFLFTAFLVTINSSICSTKVSPIMIWKILMSKLIKLNVVLTLKIKTITIFQKLQGLGRWYLAWYPPPPLRPPPSCLSPSSPSTPQINQCLAHCPGWTSAWPSSTGPPCVRWRWLCARWGETPLICKFLDHPI